MQDVFKESERGLTRSPTMLDPTSSTAGVQDSDQVGGAHTDRSYGKATTHDQSRHDRKKKDETKKKMEPSMKWKVLENDDKDKDKSQETTTTTTTTTGTKVVEKQLRIKSSKSSGE